MRTSKFPKIFQATLEKFVPSIFSNMVKDFFLFMSFAPVQAQVGSAAPKFSLQDLEGTTHTPEQYQGKVLVLFLFGHN